MRLSFIGAGYVGLVSASCFAKLGNAVSLIDIDQQKLKVIGQGRSPIYEEGLDELLGEVHLDISDNYQSVIDSDITFLCINTPTDERGVVLDYISAATKQIAQVLPLRRDYGVIVVKSTVVPGTTDDLIIPILEASGKKIGRDFGVCVNPEFLSEGKAIKDFMNPARIIIGEYDSRSGDVLSQLCHSLEAPVMRTSLKAAEMIKLASNTFLATKISYINEIGNICKRLGIDTYEVARGMGFDDRIGSKFLNAGVGFGGSCLPKDLWMLIAKARELHYQPRLLEAVSQLNDEQALRMIDLLKRHVPLKGAVVGLLGLAFKPDTDDIRDSRAIIIAETLLQEGAGIKAYDPLAADNFKKVFPQISYVSREAVLNADAILILTEWEGGILRD
jgi:UDPglucose 6-dehydrogenase